MIMAITALVLAFAFRKKEVRIQPVLIAAVALLSIQLLAMPLAPILSEPEKIALRIVATTAEGISSTLFMFLFLTSLIDCSTRQIAISIAAGFLLLNLYDGFFLGASEAVRLLQRPAGLLLVAVLAGVLSYRVRGWAKPAIEARGDQPQPISCAVAVPAKEQPETIADCVLLAVFVSVVLLIQGVYSQLTGLGSAGNAHAFNMFAEVFAAGVRIAVLVYCLLNKNELSMMHIAACALLICLVGIPAVELLWRTDAYLVGSHVINSARYVLLPIVSIFGVQMARRFPGKSTFLIFLAIASTNSCYVSRFAALVFVDDIAANFDSILPITSLCSMWAVACIVPALLLVRRRLRLRDDRDADPAEVSSAETAQPGIPPSLLEAADPSLMREILFYQRLESLCDKAQLTEREKEILRGVLHGYSIDRIADRLNLSSSTVKTYLSRAYTRFGVTSRQAVLSLLDSEIDRDK